MPRIKIIQDYKKYKAGETVEVSPNVAFGLIDRSVGIISKDMVSSDYSVKKPLKRTHKRSYRKKKWQI